jgi:tetratricopeptide (TPR) repeat protein
MVWSDPVEEVLASQQPAVPTWLRWVRWLLVVALLPLLFWWGYRAWVGAHIESYAAACEEASLGQRWPVLEQEAIAWARWEPANARPWQYASQAAREQGQPERAAEYLRRVPGNAAGAPTALLDLSDLQFNELNQPLEGEATCREILRRSPRVPEAHRRLVFFYAMTLQRTRLIKQARDAIQLDCAGPEIFIYLTGADYLNFSNAQQLNERWLQANPENECFQVARVIHYLGSQGLLEDTLGVDPNAKPTVKTAAHAEMLARLDEYRKRFPQDLEVLVYFLRQGCTSGDRTQVAKLLAQAPKAAEEDNRFWRFKGWLHAAREELAEGEAAYRQALQLHPFDWQSQHELAGILRRGRRLDEAASWQQRALEGKEIRKQIFQLPNVQAAPQVLLMRIARYVRDCGDHEIADQLLRQVASMRRRGEPSASASAAGEANPPAGDVPPEGQRRG